MKTLKIHLGKSFTKVLNYSFRIIIYNADILSYPTIQSSKKINKPWNLNSYELFKDNHLINVKNNNIYIKSKAGVYTTQCLDCNKKIVGYHSVIFINEFMNQKLNEKKKTKIIVCSGNLETNTTSFQTYYNVSLYAW